MIISKCIVISFIYRIYTMSQEERSKNLDEVKQLSSDLFELIHNSFAKDMFSLFLVMVTWSIREKTIR